MVKNQLNKTLLIIIIVFGLLGTSLFFIKQTLATAGVPKILSHQGRLLDENGSLLGGSGGTDFCFRFAIWNVSTGGTRNPNQLWPTGYAIPSTMTINVKNGVFNVGIGDTSAGGDTLDFNFQDNDTVFLDVEVADKVGATCAPGDGEEVFENLSPRQRIVSSGYTINSDTVDGFHASQSPTANQIPVLNSSGYLTFSSNNPQINTTGTNTFTFQGEAGTGDIQFFSSSNKITSGGALTIAGAVTAVGVNSGTGLLQGTGGLTITGTVSINTTGTSNTTIGNSAGGIITIGASTGSDLALNDAQWSVTGAGAGTFASLSSSGAIAANGGITFDQATDTVGAFTAAGTINMNANILENIGNTGTDFIASTGALTLAGVLTANGGVTIATGQSYTGSGTVTLSSGNGSGLTINSGTTGTLAIGDDTSAETINIGTGGAAKTLTIGSTNTTSSTLIQSGSGNIGLVANNTSTGNVQIGDGGAASATPDLLVLDIGSAEPTGTNGAMYYSTATNKLRCYQNNAWTDCIGAAGGTALHQITAATAANTIANGDFAQVWNWQITTDNRAAFTFGESTASSGSNARILQISTLSNSTAEPLYISHAGTQPFVQMVNGSGIEQFRVNSGGTVFANGFIAKQMQFSDEFVRVRANITADIAGGGTTGMGDVFAWGAGELGTCTWSIVADIINGIQRQATSATGSGCLTYLSAAAGNRNDILDAANNPIIVIKLKPSVIGTNNWVVAGMMDYTDGAVADPTNGIYFSSEGGSTWIGVVKSGATKNTVTCTDQTILTTQFAYMRIAISSSKVEFFIDNDVSNGITTVNCGTIETDIPSGQMTLEIMNQARTGGTAAMNLDVDYARINQDDPVLIDEISTATTPSLISRADLAEEIPALHPEEIEAGDLISLAKEENAMVKKSSQPYESTLFGVASTDPGMVLGEGLDNSVRIALLGRAPVKVNLESGPIKVGDYLTSSSSPGVAMKATKTGRVIGLALEAFSGEEEERGKVLVFLNPHWYGGSLDSIGVLSTGGETSQSTSLVAQIREALASLGLFIENGITQVKELVAERIFAKRVQVNELEMIDKATGEIYCTWIENGEWVKRLGACQDTLIKTDNVASEQQTSLETAEPLTPTAPEDQNFLTGQTASDESTEESVETSVETTVETMAETTQESGIMTEPISTPEPAPIMELSPSSTETVATETPAVQETDSASTTEEINSVPNESSETIATTEEPTETSVETTTETTNQY